MSSILDLSGADTSGFTALPSGEYNAVVYEVTMDETKGREGAKLPAGTPMVKVQFRVQDEEYKNRALFTQFVLPPAGADNADKMLGMFVRFLVALGEDEKKLKTKGFNMESLTELNGRECVLRVGQREWNGEMQNDVKGVKPAGTASTGASNTGLL